MSPLQLSKYTLKQYELFCPPTLEQHDPVERLEREVQCLNTPDV